MLLIVIGALALAVLEGLAQLPNFIDVAALPEEWQPVFEILFAFFTSAKYVFVLALGRNLWGFARNYWRSEYKTNYYFRMFGETFTYYQGWISTGIALGHVLPGPWNAIIPAIVGLLGLIIDFFLSEWRKLAGS